LETTDEIFAGPIGRDASGASFALLKENPHTYPQEMWITRAPRFC
jgi:hypothetical protein